jgi:hypothetical protein
MSSLHVGLKRKKKDKRGGVRERASERRSRRRRAQMTGTTPVVSMRYSSRLECNNKDGNKKMHIQVEGNENSVPPRSPARGKKRDARFAEERFERVRGNGGRGG